MTQFLLISPEGEEFRFNCWTMANDFLQEISDPDERCKWSFLEIEI
jgi:hypothetical protein